MMRYWFNLPLQTLSILLHCQTLEEVKLSGRDMFSLKELVLNQSSQVGEGLKLHVLLITGYTTCYYRYVMHVLARVCNASKVSVQVSAQIWL